MLNPALIDLERHVESTIDRITADRNACGPLPAGNRGFTPIDGLRQRLGSVLIKAGERVGGPAVRGPQPVQPQPTHTLMFGM